MPAWGKYLKALASWDFEGFYDIFNHFACGCGSQSHDRQPTTDVSLQAGSKSDVGRGLFSSLKTADTSVRVCWELMKEAGIACTNPDIVQGSVQWLITQQDGPVDVFGPNANTD
ncbi:MAG: hypothetical protein FRX49_00962 [Trebouxia sp. A1-2]|nr:MAG: hypothetical protein FRX49_00962 [Trebouxia sp. A1-2]